MEPNIADLLPTVGDGSGVASSDGLLSEELQLAARNRGILQEGLRYDITPSGMHYLLIHFDVPDVQADTWQLRVGGLVARSLTLTLDEIKRRPARSVPITMECAGNGRALLSPRPISQPWLVTAVGTAKWTGTPLRALLEEAGLDDRAVEVLFTGVDRGIQGGEVHAYQRSLTFEDALRDEVLLAYEMNGEPLQPQHGYPLRLVVPGWYGMTSVKWLSDIEMIGAPFEGYQQAETYRYKQRLEDHGDPVRLMKVRAVIVPPGIPDFLTRMRLVEPGTVRVIGRAWSGRKDVTRVEVSWDGGSIWRNAELGKRVSPHAWRGWSFDWVAAPGRYQLCARATDDEGNVQPMEQQWSLQGMGNNMVQRVDVIVQPGPKYRHY